MSEESAEIPRGDEQSRVRKRVRVRVEQPLSLRKRIKTAWSRHRRWVTPTLLLILGIGLIWIALTIGVRD